MLVFCVIVCWVGEDVIWDERVWVLLNVGCLPISVRTKAFHGT